jgi:hypothetical protein
MPSPHFTPGNEKIFSASSSIAEGEIPALLIVLLFVFVQWPFANDDASRSVLHVVDSKAIIRN